MSHIHTTSYSRPRLNLRTLVSMSMLTAVAYVVMLLSKMLPSVYDFLSFDFKDVIICIGGFIYGPLPAAVISIVTSVIEMFNISQTGPIGLLMNVLSTCAFCCTAALIYQKRRTQASAVIGLISGVVVMTGVMLLWNYLITPVYQGVSRDVVAKMLPTVFLPFNLAKGGLNMAATLLLYKPIVTALRTARLVEPSQSNGQKRRLNPGFLLFSLALLATFIVFALVMMGIL